MKYICIITENYYPNIAAPMPQEAQLSHFDKSYTNYPYTFEIKDTTMTIVGRGSKDTAIKTHDDHFIYSVRLFNKKNIKEIYKSPTCVGIAYVLYTNNIITIEHYGSGRPILSLERGIFSEIK